MNPIKEFAAFEGKSYAESTRRVYRSAIKKALKDCRKTTRRVRILRRTPGAISGKLSPIKVPESATIGSVFELFEV